MSRSGALGRVAADAGRIPPVVVAFAVLGAFAIAYARPLATLVQRWSDPDGANTHGFAVAAAVPLLVWLQRDRLHAEVRGRTAAAVALLAATTAFAVAHAAAVDLLVWIALPAILWCAVAVALGARAARALAVPIGFAWFAVPVWSLAAPPLQRLTAWGASLLLGSAGTRAHIDGDFVTVPAGRFEIAGGCSGVSYLLVALATGVAIAFAERVGRRRAAVLVGSAALLAVAANWLRVAIVIYVGDASAMQSPLVADHASFGWWLFAAAMGAYALLARRVLRGHPPVQRAVLPRALPAVRAASVTAVAAVALGLGPVWALGVDRGRIAALEGPALPAVAGWSGPFAPAGEWRPEFPGAAAQVQGTYVQGDASVEAFVAVYGVEGPGRKLIGEHSSIAGRGWEAVAAPDAPAGDGWSEQRVRRAGDERLVWSRYEVGGKRTSEPRIAKLLQGAAAFGRVGAPAVAGLSARCVPDCEAARRVLHAARASGIGDIVRGAARRARYP